MQTFAHIVGGVVREVLSIPDDLVFGVDLYAPDFVSDCVPCNPNVSPGMLYDAEKKKFSAAPPIPQPVPDRCSKLGLKRALAETGPDAVFPQPEWPAVKALLAQDSDLQEDWDLAVEIRRTDPLVQSMIAARKYDAPTVDKILLRAAILAA